VGAVSYIIEAGSTSGSSNLVISDTGNAATTLLATTADGTYYVRVRARNTCGVSAASNEVVLLVGSLPPFTNHTGVDRPDDTATYQIKIMYVVPNDGFDRQLDLNGTLARSVEAWERWFQGQSGGQRLRLDTYQGILDVGFFRLARTDAQIISFGAFVRDQVQVELTAAGFNDSRKVYAVYYDGGSSFSCGGGAWPPDLVGNVAAMYLKGTPPGAPGCSTNVLGASVETPGYFEFGMIHEIFHTLGFVAPCAPHQALRGHASDSPNDLMWAGNAPWQLPPRLDIGRDDYFQHGQSCLDSYKSIFMSPSTPDATTPPAWSRVTTSQVLPGELEEEMCVLTPDPKVIRVRRPRP
jgi:hypothetical protein